VQVCFGAPLDHPSEKETYDAFNNRLFKAVDQLIQQQKSSRG